MTGVPIQTLIERAQAGDREAFGVLAEKHKAGLEAFINSRLGPAVRENLDADDVLQEAYARGWELIGRFQWRGEGSLGRWLAAIAEHLILNATQKRRPLRLDRDQAGENVSPSQAYRREERFDRLQAALDHLRPDQKKAVQLARIEGLSVQEVAERMDKSPEAVKKLITRALAELRRRLPETQSLHLPDRLLRMESDDDGRK